MSDQELLRLLDTQPNEALAQILKQYGGLLNAVALAILQNPQDAEECIADTLLKLWNTRDRIEKPERLKSYLCAIARNAAIDRRRKHTPLPLSLELTETDALSEQIDALLLSELVTGAVHQLEQPTREIILQRYYGQWSIREIARYHGLSVRAVESQLYRGRKQLKTILSEGGILDETT